MLDRGLKFRGHAENKLSIASEELLQLVRPQRLALRRIGIRENNPSSSL